MTEPTAEQVNAERERARAFLRDTFSWEESYFTKFWGCDAVTKFATALARVRIEAHAAGRDEGLREADDELNGRILGTGCSGDVPMRLARDAIRALRART